MTDRELLELAAKAAGINGTYVNTWVPYISYSEGVAGNYKKCRWSPLYDDGDALRLAVKLNMLVDPNNGHVTTCSATGGFAEAEEDMSECRYAATRRAIVRAAAAIGEKL